MYIYFIWNAIVDVTDWFVFFIKTAAEDGPSKE